MAGRALGFVATFFVPLVLVRVFEPAVFGTYKQLFLIYTTLYGLGQIGMAESLYYFLPRRPESSGRYLANSTLMLLGSGSLILVLLTLGRERIAGWLSNPSLAGFLPWIGLYLLLMLAAAGLEITLLCRGRFLTATVVYLVSDLLRALALTLPVLLLGRIQWLLAGAVGFAAARLVAHLWLLARDLGRELRPQAAALGRQLAYSTPFQATVTIEIAQANLHLFAISHWFGAAAFAVYSVGCLQIPLVEIAASSAGNVLMVEMGKAVTAGDLTEARRIWRATTRKLALMLAPATVLLLLLAHDLIPFLFTETYRGAVPVFMVWTAAILLGVVQMDAALRVFAEVRFLLLINLARLAVIGALLTVSVSVLGMVGAVATTVLALALGKLMGLARLRSRLATGWRGLLPWGDLARIVVVTSGAAAPALLLWPELERGAFGTLVILGTVYAVTLVALALAAGILEEGEVPSFVRRWRRGARLPAADPPASGYSESGYSESGYSESR
jgi:O-antigen/teichoic acid export membrane protein